MFRGSSAGDLVSHKEKRKRPLGIPDAIWEVAEKQRKRETRRGSLCPICYARTYDYLRYNPDRLVDGTVYKEAFLCHRCNTSVTKETWIKPYGRDPAKFDKIIERLKRRDEG